MGATTRLPSGLTVRQERFVKAFIEHGNAADAYRNSYSTLNMRPAAMYSQAAKTLNHPKIRAAIEKVQNKVAEDTGLSAEKIQTELMRVAFSDVSEICDWDAEQVVLKGSLQLTKAQTAGIAEIRQTKEGVRVRMHDKIGALDKLAKILNMFEKATPGDNATVINGPDAAEVRRQLFRLLSDRNRSESKAIPVIIESEDRG